MLLAALLAALLQQEGPVRPPAVEPAQPPSWMEEIHGTYSMRYRGRWTGDARDNDLYGTLLATYGDPEKDTLTGAFSGRIAEDLDGGRHVNGAAPFGSVEDSYHSSTTTLLTSAYVDVNRLATGLLLRGGRQVLDEMSDAVTMDGALARWKISDSVVGTVFGGLPANLFEASPSHDAMYGGAIEVVPWERGRVRAEYMHIQDKNVFGLFKDDLATLSLDHYSETTAWRLRYSLLEGESRDVAARLTAMPAEGLVVNLLASYTFESIQAIAYAADPYATFLLTLKPYAQLSATISKTLSASFVVEAAVTSRRLVEGADESSYNHEFTRLNATVRTADWPFDRVSVSLSGDRWQSTADDFWTTSGDVVWTASRAVRVSAGTSFALYVIDAFTGEERESVRSFYGGVRWKMSADTTFDVRASVDRDEGGTFTTHEIGARRAF